MFSESGSIGRFGAQPSRTFSYNRGLHFEAIDSLVPLQLACLLLFWIQHDWHYLLWLIAACAIPMFAITAGTNRYVATDDELIELKRANRLSLPGVKSLN